MAIHKTAYFRVRPAALDKCKQAIRVFVEGTRDEPGTLVYFALQDTYDPTSFLQVMTFADAAAENAHRSSANTSRFVSVLYPETIGGVRFTDCKMVSSRS